MGLQSVTTNIRCVTSEKSEDLTGTLLFNSKVLLNDEVLEFEGKAPFVLSFGTSLQGMPSFALWSVYSRSIRQSLDW